MCNADNAVIMQEVVEEFVQDERAFTAFDATQEGMQRGTTERHRSLKGQVHANMQSGLSDGSYERSLIPTPTGDAWLYHPAGYDVQKHAQRLQIDAAQSAGRMSRNSTAYPKTGKSDGEQKQRQIDNDGRLNIPVDFLVSIGCRAGATIQVGSVNDEMVLSKKLGDDAVADYVVNGDGRVRVGQSVLENVLSIIAVSPNRTFNIMLDKDLKRIVVTL
jgi:hypothetical protein